MSGPLNPTIELINYYNYQNEHNKFIEYDTLRAPEIYNHKLNIFMKYTPILLNWYIEYYNSEDVLIKLNKTLIRQYNKYYDIYKKDDTILNKIQINIIIKKNKYNSNNGYFILNKNDIQNTFNIITEYTKEINDKTCEENVEKEIKKKFINNENKIYLTSQNDYIKDGQIIIRPSSFHSYYNKDCIINNYNIKNNFFTKNTINILELKKNEIVKTI
jgi:hypothetical protein